MDQIAGSLNRYHEFDQRLPSRQRYVGRALAKRQPRLLSGDQPSPGCVIQSGEVYFVVDGHHRVSVARRQGQIDIEAEVRECATRVNITPDIKTEDLEILGEQGHFLERTSIDNLSPEANIKLTIPDGFDRMLEHIAVHRYFMGLDWKRDISEEEAIKHWYETVYMPIIHVIRETEILKDFPDKTEGDLYLWVLDHQHYLAKEEGIPLQSPETAARVFLEKKNKGPAHPKKKKPEQNDISTPSCGVYAAAVTPLHIDNSTIDHESVPVLLKFLASRGCHGAVLFGTTGEGPSFSPSERETLLRSARAYRNQLRGFKLIAGTGAPQSLQIH